MRILLLLPCLLFTACQQENRTQTTLFEGNAMTMDYKIIVGKALLVNETERIEGLISATFQEVDAVFNKWNPQSEISKLNQLKAGELAPLSPPLAALFAETDALYHLCDGRFDPTIEPLQALWKKYLLQRKLPSETEIAAIAPSIGWHHIHVDHGIFRKDHEATQLDFGGIAKGFAVDMLTERLTAAGLGDVFVEWGGEIRAAGRHPEGRPWTVFISRFGSTDPNIAIDYVPLEDAAIATSGDYLQYWTVPNAEGQEITFFHIFDPLALRPLFAHTNAVSSASVLAPTCAIADTLATAAMMFPSIEEAQEWAIALQEKMPSVRIWLVSANPSYAEERKSNVSYHKDP